MTTTQGCIRAMNEDSADRIDEVGVQLLLNWFFDTTPPEAIEFDLPHARTDAHPSGDADDEAA